MQTRSRIFLTFSLFCILPLLFLSILTVLFNLRSSESLLRDDLERELSGLAKDFELLLRERKDELQNLAASSAMRNYARAERWQGSQAKVSERAQPFASTLLAGNELKEVRSTVSQLLLQQDLYAAIAAFSSDKHLLFVAEPPQQNSGADILFRTDSLLPDQVQPDDAVWTTADPKPQCTMVSQASLGRTWRCTAPVFIRENESNVRGALVANLGLDSLVSRSARRSEVPSNAAGTRAASTIVIALDDSGTIVYHTNDALKHQPSSGSMPYFASIANAMMVGNSGTNFFNSKEGDTWLAAYAPLAETKLSLALARNYSLASQDARRFGWLTVMVALVIGIGVTLFLSTYYLKRSQSIDRVAAGVDEIAKGKLDHRIMLRSSDDLRPLADNVGLVTKQLREQIAREAEGRQFQSFVRLSAILTHDLKNAIEALSLTVTNMERHFDNQDFRADAMKTLSGATENLRALVARLSNPVTTLSGEHKRPRPVDLVPILKRVISLTAGQAREAHDVKIQLPESLFAFVDAERIVKVAENLIINALESMSEKNGTLTIAAGETEDGKVFFSVSDTGEGMNQRFIEDRLFHPFATTKKKGVGLGLYTCREVVRANAGSIQVESEEGLGATFRVVLPSAAINKDGA